MNDVPDACKLLHGPYRPPPHLLPGDEIFCELRGFVIVADYSDAIRLSPDDGDAYNNRGIAHQKKGELDEAIADLNVSLRLNPKSSEAYNTRGNAYNDRHDYAKAAADFNAAIGLDPRYATACNNLAWLLAVCPDAGFRNGTKAVEYGTKACELTDWKNPD